MRCVCFKGLPLKREDLVEHSSLRYEIYRFAYTYQLPPGKHAAPRAATSYIRINAHAHAHAHAHTHVQNANRTYCRISAIYMSSNTAAGCPRWWTLRLRPWAQRLSSG
jgi:hypothetical protein